MKEVQKIIYIDDHGDTRVSYKYPELNRDEMLDHLRLVGKEKLLGYLPLSTLIEKCATDPNRLKMELDEAGLKTFFNHAGNDFLYAFDEAKLQAYLDQSEQQRILYAQNWPTSAEGFARHVAEVTAKDKDLYDLIALTFNDKRPDYLNYQTRPNGPTIPQL